MFFPPLRAWKPMNHTVPPHSARIRRCTLLLVALANLPCGTRPLSAQASNAPGTLSGTVTDVTGNALQAAKITISPGDLTVLTDAEGLYTVLRLAPGTYTVSYTYAGFQNITATAQVLSGQTTRVDEHLAVSGDIQQVQVLLRPRGR